MTYYGLYKTMIGFLDTPDVLKLFLLIFLISILHLISSNILLATIVSIYSLTFIVLLATRLFFYTYRNIHVIKTNDYQTQKKTIAVIVGGGEATAIFLNRKVALEYHIIGIFDDNLQKKGRNISGLRILGTVEEMLVFLKNNHIDHVIYMIPSVNINKHKPIFNQIQRNYPNIDFLSAPNLNDINAGLKNLFELTNDNFISVNKYTVNTKVNPDMLKKLKGNTVLITGGAGSIGKSLVENLFELVEDITIVVIDNDESASYYLTESLPSHLDEKKLIIHLGDYGDINHINGVLKKYQPVFVYHAGAYKHVNLLESGNIYSAIYNNCLKAIRLARMVRSHSSIKYFILVSTDKAVNPTNIMGLSKRIVEIALNKLFDSTPTTFITVRFGNVVGSNGSVFHKFLHQIKSRQKITLTHRSVTRFFMNINQAAILTIKASIEGKSGKVYIFNMGNSIRIYDFLVSMIERYGSEDQKSKIVITGLKPGEKIKEELFFAHEKIKKFDESMFEGSLKKIDFDLDGFEVFFKQLKDTTDEEVIRAMLKKIKIK